MQKFDPDRDDPRVYGTGQGSRITALLVLLIVIVLIALIG